MSQQQATPRGPLVEEGQAMPRPSAGFLYVLSVPVAAGLAVAEKIDVLGVNYSGLLWLFLFLAGGLLVLVEMTEPGGSRSHLPVHVWLVWLGWVWLSLLWCEPLTARNVQDALQLSTPLATAVAASMFVRSEEQLEQLLGAFVPCVVLLALAALAGRLGVWDRLGLRQTARSLALTAALAGCVFMARFPQRVVGPLAGWGACVLLTVVTGSRMATVAMLLIPVLQPLYRTHLWRVVLLLGIAALGVAIFHTKTFQERFFWGGSGTLEDVLEGNFLSFGRFEAWPDIWDEAWRRPWFGHGVGSAYDFVPTVWENMHQVHNDYLRVGFELGLVGLAVYLFVLVWQLSDLAVCLRSSEGITRPAFAAAWMGLLVLVISSLTDNTLGYNLWYTNPLFAVLGAAHGVAARTGAERKEATWTPG
jgi:O-antigen ligase